MGPKTGARPVQGNRPAMPHPRHVPMRLATSRPQVLDAKLEPPGELPFCRHPSGHWAGPAGCGRLGRQIPLPGHGGSLRRRRTGRGQSPRNRKRSFWHGMCYLPNVIRGAPLLHGICRKGEGNRIVRGLPLERRRNASARALGGQASAHILGAVWRNHKRPVAATRQKRRAQCAAIKLSGGWAYGS